MYLIIRESRMKLAIVGSRDITNISNDTLDKYIDKEVSEIVSGGAFGIDTIAAQYAKSKGLRLTEFLPDYARYKRGAPIVRNKQIVDCADKILVFWNGSSKGTLSVINYAKKTGKPTKIILCK